MGTDERMSPWRTRRIHASRRARGPTESGAATAPLGPGQLSRNLWQSPVLRILEASAGEFRPPTEAASKGQRIALPLFAADLLWYALSVIFVALHVCPAIIGSLQHSWRKIRRGLVGDARADHDGCASYGGEANSERK